MRTLCSNDAAFWSVAPMQGFIGQLPPWIIKHVVKIVFISEVEVKLEGHVCDSNAPCVTLGREIWCCVRLRLVCKTWNSLVQKFVQESKYGRVLSKLSDVTVSYSGRPPARVGLKYSLNGRYRGHTSIEEESDKCVLRAYDYGSPDGCCGKTEVIIKISTSYTTHENEKIVYNWLDNSAKDESIIPHLHYEGSYASNLTHLKALVLERLGLDLERLRRMRPHQRFTPRMTLAVAIQTVRLYENLHARGWLHTNAKPGNFAIGPDLPGRYTKIYMFDFEFSKHISQLPEIGDDVGDWNYRFRPPAWEYGLTQSRRDDMEGLAYVFSHLEKGGLPWNGVSDSTDIWRLKVSTSTKKLFEGMDPAYMLYFDEVKALAWGEIPNYEGIIQRFCQVWEKKEYGGTPGELDWWGELNLRP